MSPQSQRIAIAEACGWIECHPATKTPHGFFEAYGRKKLPCGSRKDGRLPDYLNDLNAMHEAEKRLFDTHQSMGVSVYYHLLIDLCKKNPALAVQAPANIRAEAFLRTLGKWKEGA